MAQQNMTGTNATIPPTAGANVTGGNMTTTTGAGNVTTTT
jgi:hypothetical protein